MAQHNCDLSSNISQHYANGIGNAWHWNRLERKVPKKVNQTYPMDMLKEITSLSKLSLTCSDDEENVSLWRFTIKATLLKSAKSALVIVVFGRVGGWGQSLALFCRQIFHSNLATLANSRVLPPKQNKQSSSPHNWTFFCCQCLIWCLTLFVINVKFK